MKMRTKDFAEYLDAQLAVNRELSEGVDDEELNAEIACMIVEVREAANLSQKQLAQLIGTHQSVISRLEDADYEGHSLSMLRRIASALAKKVHIEFRDRTPATSVSVSVNSVSNHRSRLIRDIDVHAADYAQNLGLDDGLQVYCHSQDGFYGRIIHRGPQPILA